jgi:hypothetical protein
MGDPADVQLAHRRTLLDSPEQSSGFWAAKDEALTIDVAYQGTPPNRAPELWIESIANADGPDITRQIVKLKPGSNVVAVTNSGVIYFVARGESGGGAVSVTLKSGGREIPRFVLDQNTKDQWATILNRASAEPYAELVGKRMIITLPLALMKSSVDDPVVVLQLWDRIVALAEAQYGIAPEKRYPSRTTPFHYHFVTKPDSTGGWMSATDYWLGTNADGAKSIANSVELSQNGWGPWHELGHHYQMAAMTWDDQTEVTCNLTSLYVQRAFGQRSRLETDGVWNHVQQYLNQTQTDFNAQGDLFVRAAMYWQLDLAFGKDFYARLGQRLRTLPMTEVPYTNDQKQQSFIVEASRVAGHDLLPFFDKWGVRASTPTRDAIAAMRLAPLDKPIWQNRDESLLYTYAASEQAPAGELVMPASVAPGGTFAAQVNALNTQGKQLTYNWSIPDGFSATGATSPSVSLTASARALPGAYVPIRVVVSDGKTSMTLSSSIQMAGSLAPMYEAMVLAASGKTELRQWAASQSGTVGDVYVYDNPYRHTRDYFRLKTATYGYFPIDGVSAGAWEFLDSYTGGQYSPTQVYDIRMLAQNRKSIRQEWSGTRTGTVGDLYVYENGFRGTHDYFMLNRSNYWYFPTNATSNGDWQYLGSYDGSQYLQ